MESSTKSTPKTNRMLVPLHGLLEDNVQGLEDLLHLDLERSAKQTKAFVRKRGIQSAADLLRLVLMYVASDWSFKQVAWWALVQGMGALSDVAVLKRLRHCAGWLGCLIGQILQRRCQALQQRGPVRVRLMDASVINRPGRHGTDWRLHLSLNLHPLGIDGIELTDAHGGETLARFAPQDQEIRIADRGYAFVSGMVRLLAEASFLVVRINWQNMPLESEPGQRFDLIAWLTGLSVPGEQRVWLPTPAGRFALRLLAAPLPPQAAERARQRARQNNSKRGRTVSEQTLRAAGFVLLLTNLPAPAWPFAEVLGLYRLRWQIELAIKRLKSLLHIDQLRVQDPQLVQTYVLGKLLLALMLDELVHQVAYQQPEWFLSLERPISVWRLTQFLGHALSQWILGPVDWTRLALLLPAARRYFCDSPRARPQQLAYARAFLDAKAAAFSLFSC
jgi:hypothetical protein